MRLQIEVRIGSIQKQQILTVAGKEMLIGRRADWLGQDDEFLSKAHAKLVIEADGTIRLVDLGSRNGTFVNGKRVSNTTICAGDEIQCGRTFFRVIETASRKEAVVRQWPAFFTCYEADTQRRFRGQF